MELQRYGLVFVGFLIIALVLAAPVSAARSHPAGPFNLTMAPAPAPSGSHTLDGSSRAMFDAAVAGDMSVLAPSPALTVFESIGPGDSLQDAIDAAPDGSTIYLDPGTYYEHDLVVNKVIRICANETLGGTRANTIIDARGEGRIFTVESGDLLFLDNLTLQNGLGSGNGGAISTTGGDIVVMFTTITNCSATGDGGAVYSHGGAVFVLYSAISRCSVTGSSDGGAIYSEDDMVLVGYTTFSDCSAPGGWGGAIEADSHLVVGFSTFTRCSAIDGGALDFYEDGAIVFASTFTDCTATRHGGAIWYLDGGSLELVSSTFTRCSAAENGGAIAARGDTLLEDVTFSGCTATGYGGAVYIFGGSVTTDSSLFTGCTATLGGGAIAALPTVLTITSSSFERCSAGADGGGAILSFATTTVHFSRFYQNTATGSGTAIRFVSGTIDANNNWWGTNSGPGTSFYGPSAAVASWLVLGITADPASITLPQTSYIRTNLTYNSDGTNTAIGGIYLPDSIPNAYAVISGPGIVAPETTGTINSAARTTYITLQPGTTTIAGTVDGQTVYITLNVDQG
ncbi:MAG: hypothetical protein LUQ35_00680, partial [Methanoregula sp.]|nr:hypothetical protein [Methanoregula sp.]